MLMKKELCILSPRVTGYLFLDYSYCWRNFVAYQPGEDPNPPENVSVYFFLNCTELFHIFLVSRHLKKTPRVKINVKSPRKRRFG